MKLYYFLLFPTVGASVCLFIGFFAMGDPQDENSFLRGIDPIDDSIIARSEPVQTLQRADQLLDVWVALWIGLQKFEA